MKTSDVSLADNEVEFSIRFHHALLRPDDISPLKAYYALKDLFGAPNGTFDETKSQWAYFLRAPNAYLDIYDWKLESWSIAIYEDSSSALAEEIFGFTSDDIAGPEFGKKYSEFMGKIDVVKAEKIGNEFLALIRKHVPKSAARIKKVAAKASQFVLQNPFALYYNSAVSLLEEAPKAVTGESNYLRSAFFLFMAAFEGLLNLIYELYLKGELRDGRIYERLAREQIDIKVRLASLYCNCFSDKPFDHSCGVFKEFRSIVGLRNNFIHANLTSSMKRPIVVEDGHTFIVEQSNRDKHGLPKSIDALTKEDLELIRRNINQMIDLLAEGMKPRFRREFGKILKEDYIQVIVEDGEMIVV